MSNSENNILAEFFAKKAEAAKLTTDAKYNEAINIYEELVKTVNLDDKEIAKIYCNKAICELKLEKFGNALQTANIAIDLDHTYVKAYYRKALALIYLNKPENALDPIKTALSLDPENTAIRQLYNSILAEYKEQLFNKSIVYPDAAPLYEKFLDETINYPNWYKGPKLPENLEGNEAFFDELADFFNGKIDYKMPDQLVAKIIAKATQFSKTLPNVVRIDSDVAKATVTVCGDIHGQYYDLLNIFKLNGKPSETNYYVFNGDFVDRGSFSLEVIITLYVCRLIWPKFIHLTRGNHESKDMTQLYGFKHETEKKTNSSIYNLFIESFEYLPLAHIISERIFVVHGGLPSTKGVTIDKINSLLRVKNSDPIITDLLWADPGVAEGTSASQRGVSHVFGPDYTEDFLKTNNLDLVIRSHEVKNSGWEKMHNDKLYTIFSAPNYCDTMQNLGAYLKFSFSKLHDKNWQVEPEIIEFKEVTHPSVPAMQYSAFNF